MPDRLLELWTWMAKVVACLLLVLCTLTVVSIVVTLVTLANQNTIVKGQEEGRERGCLLLYAQHAPVPDSCEGVDAP